MAETAMLRQREQEASRACTLRLSAHAYEPRGRSLSGDHIQPRTWDSSMEPPRPSLLGHTLLKRHGPVEEPAPSRPYNPNRYDAYYLQPFSHTERASARNLDRVVQERLSTASLATRIKRMAESSARFGNSSSGGGGGGGQGSIAGGGSGFFLEDGPGGGGGGAGRSFQGPSASSARYRLAREHVKSHGAPLDVFDSEFMGLPSSAPQTLLEDDGGGGYGGYGGDQQQLNYDSAYSLDSRNHSRAAVGVQQSAELQEEEETDDDKEEEEEQHQHRHRGPQRAGNNDGVTVRDSKNDIRARRTPALTAPQRGGHRWLTDEEELTRAAEIAMGGGGGGGGGWGDFDGSGRSASRDAVDHQRPLASGGGSDGGGIEVGRRGGRGGGAEGGQWEGRGGNGGGNGGRRAVEGAPGGGGAGGSGRDPRAANIREQSPESIAALYYQKLLDECPPDRLFKEMFN